MPIRQLNAADKSTILEMDKIIFGSSDGGWSSEDFDHFFSQGSCYVFHEENKPDEIIGYIFSGQNNKGTYISNIAVKNGHEGQGIGRELMKVVMLKELERSKDNVFSTTLQVRADNVRAKKLYEHLGYQETSSNGVWVQMEATTLPRLFLDGKEQVMSQRAKSRQVVIIRNIEAMDKDERKIALDGLEVDDKAPREFNELITLVNSNDELNHMQWQKLLSLFKNERVRNYIYETIKEKTGNHVIYHLNGLDNNGRTNQNNADYIVEKLKQIPSNSHFDMMYLGGGHGDPTLGSSNLTTNQLIAITNVLKEHKINFDSVILGSCFSTAYSDLYQPLLKQNGVMISNSLECGVDNNFKQSMEWMNGKRDEFFLRADFNASERGLREARSGIKRMLEAEISRDQLSLNADELFEEYNKFITNMQAQGDGISNEQIRGFLSECPNLNKHLSTLINKRVNQHTSSQEAEDIVFSSLKSRVLQPYPTSFAVSAAGTLTLINFNQFDEMPPNVSDDYRKNYETVVQKIRRSGKFKVNEVTEGFDGVSAKKQFNVYLASAISQTGNVKQGAHVQDETVAHVQDETVVHVQDETVAHVQDETVAHAQDETVAHVQDETVAHVQDGTVAHVQEETVALVRKEPGVQAKEDQNINEQNKNEPKLILHQEIVTVSMNKIDAVLQTLENKIGTVDQHHFPEAVEKARTLLSNLRGARDTYYANLKEPDCEIESAGTQFKQACKDAITKAKPVLARDLSWGEYLGNILRTLANAVITVVSLGQANSFFTLNKSKSETDVEQAATDILNIGEVKHIK